MPNDKDVSREQMAKMQKLTEQVAQENKVQTSNGNRQDLAPGERNDAQLGGPDLRKAQSHQPPDATRIKN